MDRLVAEKRSWNMSRISGRNTKPELEVRHLLHRLGYRFRLHRHDLPGTPDIVLPKYRTVIFVHGCFWHRHADCRYAYMPKSNVDFWNKKFSANVKRDAKVHRSLEQAGWQVVIVWECQLRDPDQLSSCLSSSITDAK